MGGDAGADGSGPEIDFANQQRGFAQPLLVLAEHHGIGHKFLPQGHRHGILQLGAADFQDIPEFPGLVRKGLAQPTHRGNQGLDAAERRDLERGRVDIIGALADIDMLVGVQLCIVAARMAQNFQSAVGDHLIGIHIGGSACAALNDIDDKMPVPLPVADFLAGLTNRLHPALIEQAQLEIRLCRRLFDGCQGIDEIGINGNRGAGDRKILDRPQRMHAVIGARGHVFVADQVMLASGGQLTGGLLAYGHYRTSRWREACR